MSSSRPLQLETCTFRAPQSLDGKVKQPTIPGLIQHLSFLRFPRDVHAPGSTGSSLEDISPSFLFYLLFTFLFFSPFYNKQKGEMLAFRHYTGPPLGSSTVSTKSSPCAWVLISIQAFTLTSAKAPDRICHQATAAMQSSPCVRALYLFVKSRPACLSLPVRLLPAPEVGLCILCLLSPNKSSMLVLLYGVLSFLHCQTTVILW